jgi:succinate-semialdehyde dehydrogenase / glutarate-semialdehyde dehydrogenase
VKHFKMKLQNPSLLKTGALIDGVWIAGNKKFAVHNPATGVELTQVADLGVAETKTAIAAAKMAQGRWAKLTGKQRGQILRRWFELMVQHADDLAAIMTAEQGKPLAEAKGEILYAASFLEWFGEEAKRVYGDIIPETKPGTRILVMKQPVGVVGSITPWNFPSAMITRKCAPALAAGCTVVLKPAKQTPLSALALGELAIQAGVPKGVLNIITSSNSSAIGMELCTNPDVRKIGFTGSTEVGKILMRQAAVGVKKMSLELGGNAPFIVFDDADIDAAVAGAIISKFRNAGQTCICANRIFVQKKIAAEFNKKLVAAMAQLKIGNGVEAGVTIGPLIDQNAVTKVQELVDDAKNQGAQIALGGAGHALGGLFYQPTLITGATPNMRLHAEEIFGPVAAVYEFDQEAEAIQLANNTEYGLAAYFYARDLGRVFRVAEALEYGMVAVNEAILSTEVAPFGGIKESGFGREGSFYGIQEYVETKYVLVGGL